MLFLYCYDVVIDNVGRALVGVVDPDSHFAQVVAKSAALKDLGVVIPVYQWGYQDRLPNPLPETVCNLVYSCLVSETTRPGIAFVYRDK